MICDFCSEPKVTEAFSCPDAAIDLTLHGEAIGGVNCRGAWMACWECAQLIHSGDKEGLARRSAELFPVRHPECRDISPKGMLSVARQVQGAFWALRAGGSG
jgi:hypothetical protein